MIDPDEIDWIAAQYALGALPPGERRLVQARIRQDHLLAAAIDAWERRLAPLTLREPGLPPPPRVLEGVLATIAQQRTSGQVMQVATTPAARAASEQAPRTFRRRTSFVAVAAALGVFAIGLGAVLVDWSRRPQDQITALLAPADQSPTADEPTRVRGATFAAVLDPNSRLFTIRRSAGEAARADRTHVLWMITGSDGEVTLIGRLEREGPTVLHFNERTAQLVEQGWLMVTLEAEGRNTMPRGPTIASGRLLRSR